MKYLLTGEESERLRYELVDRRFHKEWISFFLHPDPARFLGMTHIPTPEAQADEWFRRVAERYDNDLGGMNALIDKKSGAFVGQCGLLVQVIEGVTELEIGYSILPKYWGLGYAPEAAAKCRDYAFINGFAESLISIINNENTRSESVALKNGMTKTFGTTFKNMPVNIFRITKEEWLKRSGQK